MQFVDLSFGEGHEPDVMEGKPLVDAGDVLLISAQAVEGFGDHKINGADLAIVH